MPLADIFTKCLRLYLNKRNEKKNYCEKKKSLGDSQIESESDARNIQIDEFWKLVTSTLIFTTKRRI